MTDDDVAAEFGDLLSRGDELCGQVVAAVIVRGDEVFLVLWSRWEDEVDDKTESFDITAFQDDFCNSAQQMLGRNVVSAVYITVIHIALTQ